jgi:hypothetical protein
LVTTDSEACGVLPLTGKTRFKHFYILGLLVKSGDTMRYPQPTPAVLLVAFSLAIFFQSQPYAQNSSPPKTDAKTVAEVDAGLGPCTADFVITDAGGSPVYAASIRVHISYGFMNFHKFDLTVGTNAEGKARFVGLPENPRQGLFFHASEGGREGSAYDNPLKSCKAQFTIILRKQS